MEENVSILNKNISAIDFIRFGALAQKHFALAPDFEIWLVHSEKMTSVRTLSKDGTEDMVLLEKFMISDNCILMGYSHKTNILVVSLKVIK